MKDDKKVPQLRFPEFTDAWKQRKFGEFVERKSDSALSSTSIPSVEYENVESETGVLKKDIYVKTEFKKGVLFSDKDVLYGKLRPYLHNWLAPSFTGVAVGDWWVLSPKNCSKDFLYRLLQTLTFDEIANQTSGTKMPRADWNLVSSTAFYIPSSIEEQAKIGSLFNRIDSTITLQQRKLNSLQKLKKGLLQKMFPKNGENIPEIRFPEFSDAWKQCKLSDLVNVIDGDRGKNYPTEADFEPHGHTLFLNASNVTIDGFLFDTNQFITEEKSNSMGSGKIIKDDIIITSRGSLGHIAWYNDSVQQVMPHLRINSGMLILRNKANVKTSYLHQFMKSDKGKAQIVFMSFGSAQPQLTKKGVESFTVNYPVDTEEQIKIGAFFSKLDNTITLQQRWLFYTHKQS